jgi:hypothetical protein
VFFNNFKEICIESNDITQFIDQDIIERLRVYVIVKTDDPVSELAYLNVGLFLIFGYVTSLTQDLNDFSVCIRCS